MLQCYTHSLAWLQFLILLGNAGLFFYLIRYGTRSSTIVWFQTILLNGVFFAASSGLMYCSQSAASFEFWLNAYNLTNCVSLVAVVIFTLHFVSKQHLLNNGWIRALLILVPITLLWLFWLTNLITVHDFAQVHTVWGYHTYALGTLTSLVGLALVGGYVLPIAIIWRYYRRLEEPTKKKEVKLVLAAFVIGILPGVAIEGILPAFFHTAVPPISSFFNVIMNFTIAYAITRYGLRVFSLDNVTSNIVQIMPGGLIILDHTNTIQYVNAGAAEMLDYSPGQLQGTSAKKLFAGATEYGLFQTQILSRLGDTSQVTGQEAQFITRHKQPLSVSLNAAPVYYGQQLVNRLISFTDITQLKQTEAALEQEKAGVERKVIERTRELTEAQAQLTASVRSLPFGFAVINRKNEVLFANELLGEFAGQTIPSEAAGQSHQVLQDISDGFKPAVDIPASIKEAETKRKPLERNIVLGPRFFRFYFAPVLGKRVGQQQAVLGTILLVEDTTEAKSLERSRDEFFSIASHELRTPLTAIRGNADMIKSFYKKQLEDPGLAEMVGDIYAASVRLIDIVNDFLDTSRLEQGRTAFSNEPFNLPELIREALREYDVTASRRKVALEFESEPDPGPWVVADRDRVRQVLINLVSNAMRATEQGAVKIRLQVEDKIVKIFVTDTGKGIPVAAQHLLFHKFQQAGDNILTRDSTQSTGLGLYISQLLAQGMHGRLYLDSTEVGKGSVFVLELPRDQQTHTP